MFESLSIELNSIPILLLVRITGVLSLAWLLHFATSGRNPNMQLLVWRVAIGFVFGAVLLTVVCSTGWGPGIHFAEESSTEANLIPGIAFEPVGISFPNVETVEKIDNDLSTRLAPQTLATDSQLSTRTNSVCRPENSLFNALATLGNAIFVGILIYILVILVLLSRLIRDWLAIQRVVADAVFPDANQLVETREMVGEFANSNSIDVIFSRQTSVPMAIGVFKKTIVIPSSFATQHSTSDLKFVIAHECHHFNGNDLFWGLIVHIARIGLWFHPLVWQIGNAHRLACDIRCDALAADGDSDGYSKMLASIALTVGRQQATAVSMAVHTRSDSVRRLIQIESGTNGRMTMYQSFAIALFVSATFAVAASFGTDQPENETASEVVVVANKQDEDKESAPANIGEEALGKMKKMLVASFVIKDQNGNPIENATITVTGLRTRGLDVCSAYGNRFRETCVSQTDSNGEAAVDYPKFVNEELETGQVIFSIEHPDYVYHFNQGRAVDELIEVELTNGKAVRLAGFDAESGEQIVDNIFAISPSGINSGIQWKRNKNGELVSSAISSNISSSSSVMLAAIRTGQPTLFSDLVDLSASGIANAEVQRVELRPGNVIKGQLDKNVPRPIRDGKVMLGTSQSLDGTRGSDSSVAWRDVVDVNEDGTFEFKSVPNSEFVHMLATCDGWNSKSPDSDSRQAIGMQNSIMLPQKFKIETEQVAEIGMEQEAELTVRVVDDSGNPIAGVQITMSPNHAMPGHGSIWGLFQSTSEYLVLVDKNPKGRGILGANFPFVKTTDANGIAVINRLPTCQLGIQCNHIGYQTSLGYTTWGRRSRTVDHLAPGDSKTMEIVLEPKPNQ